MCDNVMESWSSVESTKSIKSYDRVPEEHQYKLKLISWAGKYMVGLKYTVKKGRDLPFETDLKGRFKIFGLEIDCS